MSRLNGMSNRGMGNKIGGFYWQNRIYQVQIRGEMKVRISLSFVFLWFPLSFLYLLYYFLIFPLSFYDFPHLSSIFSIISLSFLCLFMISPFFSIILPHLLVYVYPLLCDSLPLVFFHLPHLFFYFPNRCFMFMFKIFIYVVLYTECYLCDMGTTDGDFLGWAVSMGVWREDIQLHNGIQILDIIEPVRFEARKFRSLSPPPHPSWLPPLGSAQSMQQ